VTPPDISPRYPTDLPRPTFALSPSVAYSRRHRVTLPDRPFCYPQTSGGNIMIKAKPRPCMQPGCGAAATLNLANAGPGGGDLWLCSEHATERVAEANRIIDAHDEAVEFAKRGGKLS
jgi:hypothetical protein